MLPKADKEKRPPVSPIMRPFEHCPDCGKYIAPGFRTDCCPFCWADFTGTKEFEHLISLGGPNVITQEQVQRFYGPIPVTTEYKYTGDCPYANLPLNERPCQKK